MMELQRAAAAYDNPKTRAEHMKTMQHFTGSPEEVNAKIKATETAEQEAGHPEAIITPAGTRLTLFWTVATYHGKQGEPSTAQAIRQAMEISEALYDQIMNYPREAAAA